MGKNINLNSGEWCEIVFDGKNKNYGAYKLRQSSSKRHIAAFLVMFIFAAVVAVLPDFVGFMKEQLAAREQFDGIDEAREMSNIPIEEQVKEENIAPQEVAPPPPPLKSTVRFTPPVITEDSKIKDEDMMKSQEDLSKTKVTISVADVSGTDDKHGIDIADLKEHKVIVEKAPAKEEPFVTVEQMPTFPGGDAEMQKFIRDNLKYPVVAQENGTQGRVIIRFVVTKTGEISDVRVLRGIDKSCDQEALRVVKAMPKWIPGKQNGRNVPVYFTLPVLFRLRQ